MGEDGPINVKALRAKFQEEALLDPSRTSRPAVAEKPRHLPPPGVGSSVVTTHITATEHKAAAAPRVIVRDGLRASGGKRPSSFPPQPQQKSTYSQFTNGDNTTTQSLKDRHMPRVLPTLPLKDPPAKMEHKLEPVPVKDIVPQSKLKKKGLLLPFKSSKAPKVSPDNGEEPTYADLTTRPSSAPGELPSFEKQTPENGVWFQGDQSTTECPLSSPDTPVTPPSTETSVDSDNRIISTLERAKKKFSRRQMLISSKPKSLRSPDYGSKEKAFPSPPKHIEGVPPDPPVPPPVCLPHLACLSARPFFKANNSARKAALDKLCGRNKAQLPPVMVAEPRSPPKKPLPELRSPGPLKPPRPPLVDLSSYHPPPINEVLPGLSQAPESEPAESEHPPIPSTVLDAPEFPDFENSEFESAEGEAVDIAALELEALDLISSALPSPEDLRGSEFGGQQPDLFDTTEPNGSSVVQDLNLGSQNIIPLDPASFPEPEDLPDPAALDEWSQSEDVIPDSLPISHTDDTELSAAECHSVPEETELSLGAAGNEEIQRRPGLHQDSSYYEAYDNVYEDVENINKFILGQNLRKHKGSLKNPYADNLPVKEEACLNIWPRNPWSSVSGEHSAQNHVLSKECQSPNTADYKEQKKREKQRLEKEKKEQKEKEKRENEMKKKFKVTGEEEPMYHAKVMVTSKVRKNDLPVKSGDTVSIIRTTNCPKGRWLARDAGHKYGYISVMNVELNIKEMLELGKKAQAAGRGGNLEGDTISIGSRSSSHPVLTSSFTDDSEEWACEDETLSPSYGSHSLPQQTAPVPETSCGHASAQHTLSATNPEELHTQNRHEALQKLAIFFQHSKEDLGDDGGGATPTNAEHPDFLCAVEEPPYPEQEVDFPELELLPPPPLYADSF